MGLSRGQRRLVALVVVLWAGVAFTYLGPAWSIAGLHFGHSPQAQATTSADGGQPAAAESVAGDAPSNSSADKTAAPAEVARGATDRETGWVAKENAAPGTDAWKITSRNPAGLIEGYARTTSAAPGTSVALFVSTAAPTFTAEVYRMGYYGGKRARLMWTSPPATGGKQTAPSIDPKTAMAEARWAPKLNLPIGVDWPAGMYLVKLVSSSGDQSYIPLTVRDDNAAGDVLVVDAVTTWQAYNQWGGCSLYECHGVKGHTRAVKVSFDRPYARQYNDGSADFLDHELPLVALIEELGIDATYATSIDLHEHPELATKAKAVLSLGHDEYYSAPMRQALVGALGRGVNIAFFGANAIYRHVRLERSLDGRANRVMANYRSQPDPVKSDPTLEWRLQGKPEASIVGIQYLCADVDADMVVTSAKHWIWAGANVHDGQKLPRLVGNESDSVARTVSPANLDLLASSPVVCGNKKTETAATAYHTTASGAGVFASGTIWWVCALDAQYCSVPDNSSVVRAATTNVLRAFAQGPAGRTHPSGQSTG